MSPTKRSSIISINSKKPISNSHNNNNNYNWATSWSDDIEIVLESIRQNSTNMSEYHKQNYINLDNKLKYYKIPLIVISGINSVMSVGLQPYIKQHYISAMNCILSLICGIIGSLELFLGIQDSMEIELNASKNFYLLAADIYKTVTLDRQSRNVSGKEYLDSIFNEYIKLYESSQIIRPKMTDNITSIDVNIKIQKLSSSDDTYSPSSTSSDSSTPERGFGQAVKWLNTRFSKKSDLNTAPPEKDTVILQPPPIVSHYNVSKPTPIVSQYNVSKPLYSHKSNSFLPLQCTQKSNVFIAPSHSQAIDFFNKQQSNTPITLPPTLLKRSTSATSDITNTSYAFTNDSMSVENDFIKDDDDDINENIKRYSKKETIYTTKPHDYVDQFTKHLQSNNSFIPQQPKPIQSINTSPLTIHSLHNSSNDNSDDSDLCSYKETFDE